MNQNQNTLVGDATSVVYQMVKQPVRLLLFLIFRFLIDLDLLNNVNLYYFFDIIIYYNVFLLDVTVFKLEGNVNVIVNSFL